MEKSLSMIIKENRFDIPKVALGFIVLLASCVPLAGLSAPPAKPKPVIIAPVTSKILYDRIEALGTTRSVESIQITSSVTEKVKSIHFKSGQKVNSGQLLVDLHKDEQLAELARAEAVRGERKLTLQRLRELDKQKLTSPDQIDRTRLELEQAEASIRAIKARIDDRMITASFDGVVGLRNISVGALVEPGDLITTLDDISNMNLDFSVPSIFLADIQPGLPLQAKAVAFVDKTFNGTVESIDTRIDPVTRTISVRALIPNPDEKLRPGLLMTVNLLRNERNALVVAEAALMPLADKHYVMRVVGKDESMTVEKVEVKTGLRSPGYIEILQGLAENDQVVTHGNDKLKPGDKLNIIGIDDGSVDIADLLKQKTD